MKKTLEKIYNLLYNTFSDMNWWPGETQFEIIVGAILTQNTAWKNVEKAIENLKRENLLSPGKMNEIPEEKLANVIKPSGFYNQKAKKLKAFINFLFLRYSGSLEKLFEKGLFFLRNELLSIHGIGNETADSILLYAGNKPIFVVDAYTKRILARHRIIDEKATYNAIQSIFMENLPKDVFLFNNYHALLVKVGKDFCKKTNPLCKRCPLNEVYP
ncbi:MAG: endonuclease III domain-containing protein [bacterium]